MFFIGQNLNHVHMTYSFFELLILFWLTQVDIYCLEFIPQPFLHHITEIFYLNTNSKGNQSWNENKHFHLFLSWIKTNIFTCFFNIKLKFLLIYISSRPDVFNWEKVFWKSVANLEETPMPKCDFNKVAHLFLRTPVDGCFWI